MTYTSNGSTGFHYTRVDSAGTEINSNADALALLNGDIASNPMGSTTGSALYIGQAGLVADDDYVVMYSGFMDMTNNTGVWDFGANADDGLIFWVTPPGGTRTLVTSRFDNSDPGAVSATWSPSFSYDFTQSGVYLIEVLFWERSGGEDIFLSATSPGGPGSTFFGTGSLGGTGVAATQAVPGTGSFPSSNTAPVIGTSANVNVVENTTSVVDVTATDDTDAENDGLTYSIVNGASGGAADWAKFTIDPTTGQLAFLTAPDFETPGSAGSSNVYNVTVRATDSGGLFHNQIIFVTVTDVDDTAPATPVLAAVIDDVSNGIGQVAANSIINDTTPDLSGTAEAGSTVRILDGATVIGTVTATGGIWSFTPTLGQGSHSLTVTATDAAGNVSAPTAAFVFAVDSIAPAAPTIQSATDNVAPLTGLVPNGGTTNDTALQLAGVAEGNSLVYIYEGENYLGQVTADVMGQWSFTTPTLTEGPHSFTSQVTDAAGNFSDFGAAFVVTVDTTAPTAPALTVTEGGNTDDYLNAAELSGNVDVRVSLTGTGALAGDSVTLTGPTATNVVILTAADITAGFVTMQSSVPMAGAADGLATYSATLTDAAGNVSPAGEIMVAIDTTAPTVTAATFSSTALTEANVGGSLTLTLTFSEVMDSAVAPVVGLTPLPAGLTLAASGWVGNGYVVTWTVADAQVDLTTVALSVSGAADLAGNPQTAYSDPAAFTINTLDPVVTSQTLAQTLTELADGAVDETTATLSATGSINFTDNELADLHTVIVTPGGTPYVGVFLAGLSDPATGDGAGTITWTYTIGDGAVDYLAAGESLVQTYDITVSDTSGGSFVRTVTVTVQGSNDVPVITGTAAETLPETNAGLSTSGMLAISDVDLSDTVSVEVLSVTPTPFMGNPSGLSLLNMLSVTAGNVIGAGAATGTINWTFNSAGQAFNYLAAGENLVLEYTIRATDSSGGITTYPVTITVQGSNDVGVVIVSNPASETESDMAAPVVVTIADQVVISELDNSDVRTPYVAETLAFSGATGTQPNGVALASLFTLNTADGTISYDRAAFNYLAAGESVVVGFSFDASSGPDTETMGLAITITGQNDAPVIVVTTPAAVSESDMAAPVVVTIADQVAISDADQSDVITDYAGALAFGSATGPAPAGGTIAALFTLDAMTGTISYDRAAFNYLAGTETVTASFTFNASSGPDSVPQTLTLTINGENDAPVIVVTTPAAVSESDMAAPVVVTIADQVAISDADQSDVITDYAGALAFGSATGPAPAGGTIAALFTLDAMTGTISYDRAAFNYLAGTETVTASFTFNASSGPDSVPQTLTLTINGENDAPVIVVTTPAAVSESDMAAPVVVTIADQVAISDADASDVITDYAGALAFGSATGPAPAGGTIAALFTLDAMTGTISYDRAAFNYLAGTETVTASFTFNASSGPDSVPQTLTLTINGENDAPVITVTTPAAVSESDMAAPVVVTIADQVAISDADQSDVITDYAGALAFGSATGPAPAGGTIAALFTLDAMTGTISYDRAAFNYLAGTETVTASFTFNASSGPDSVPQTLTLTINGENDAPVIVVTTPAAVSESDMAAPVVVTIADQVAISDADQSDVITDYAGALAFGSATGPAPAGGTIAALFTLDAMTGTISYDRAAFNYLAGTETVTASFTFNASSGPDSVPQTLTLTINGENDAPVITAAAETITDTVATRPVRSPWRAG